MRKPDSEELVPDFMQEAMNAFKASFVYFGLPALAACLLLRDGRQPFTLFPSYYAYVLTTIFARQNIFYLLHLGPALILRYLIRGARLGVKGSLLASASIDLFALVIEYPVAALLTPEVLKDIYIYSAVWPLLMTFFTLRIHRLRLSGGVVIVIFIGLLCWRFF
jgi:hypothetical protein